MPDKVRTFEEWWDSLEEGRKKVLLEDRWMMARAAYVAGGVAAAGPNHPDFNRG